LTEYWRKWRDEVLTAVRLGIPYFADAALCVEIEEPEEIEHGNI
jgi:hypothetical protein